MGRSRRDAAEHEMGSMPQMAGEVAVEDVQAWELIDTGRYMPRRIRGSFRGRELG